MSRKSRARRVAKQGLLPRSTRKDRVTRVDCEGLERRIMLAATPANVFAQFMGQVDAPGASRSIPVTLDPADFHLAGGTTLLGLQLLGADGSALDPAAVAIRDAGGQLVAPTYQNADLAGRAQSLVVAPLGLGSASLEVGGDRGTQGAFVLNVFLVGDVDGNRAVDLQDGLALRGLLGSRTGDPAFRAEADANLDGQITSFDYSLWRLNRDDSTTIDPLALDLTVSPAPATQPDGSLVSAVDQVQLRGQTLPGVTVALDSDDDGVFDDGSTIADATGQYAFDVTLQAGVNPLAVRAGDSFGQQASQSVALTFTPGDSSPPNVQAGLARDTAPFGGTDVDGLTFDPTVAGQVADTSAIASLSAGFGATPVGQFVDVTAALQPDGTFQLDRTWLETILGGPLTDGTYTLQLRAVDVHDNASNPVAVAFVLDTVAPGLAVTTPVAQGEFSATARLIGTAADNPAGVRYRIDQGGPITIAPDASGGFDLAMASSGLAIGNHDLIVESSDAAGNVASRTIAFSVAADFVVGPTGSSGWGARQVDSLRLFERDSFVVQQAVAVPLGLIGGVGTRTISFDLHAVLDLSDSSPLARDRLLVYLVDPANPGQTLLDHGTPGTPVFTLSETGSESTAGLVRFDGTHVVVDASGVQGYSSGLLVFQLVNGDADSGSVVDVSGLASVADAAGTVGVSAALAPDATTPGPLVDLSGLTATSQVRAELGDVRLDAASGRYQAALVVRNLGDSVGRTVAVVFAGLPALVTMINASGVDGSGAPYVNFRDANPAGGLEAGAASRPITLVFDDPDLLRFALNPTVLVGPANRAPVFDAVGTLTSQPGGRLEIPLRATDPDGDAVKFVLRSSGPMPTGTLQADGTLVFTPRADQLGTYTFTLAASDGALETTQQVTLIVQADTVTTTRFSGKVLDVDGTPIAGIPIELGRVSTVTAADGSFTIELPSTQLPTEDFSIAIPQGDIYFDPFDTGTQTITFRRARFDTTTGTDPSNPRLHPNLVTSFIDASIVYGSDAQRALALRTLQGGQLKTSPGDLPPLNNATYFPNGPLENDNQGIQDPSTFFVAGDVRANENVALESLHTLLMREHNRKAGELAAANPGWSDDQLYQEARKYVTALIAQITYNEYLPLLLGPGAIPAYTGYDPAVDPETGAFFASAAFRFGHSQMVPDLLLLDDAGNPLPGGPLSLREAFFTTDPVQSYGIDPILRGLIAQQAQQIDNQFVDEIRNFLFGPPGSGGQDLPSLTIQRDRDMGLPSYTQARLDLGLSPVTSFDQITSDIAVQDQLSAVYGSVDKVDAFVGGVAEDHVPGAMVGELFYTIIRDQFLRLRDGDRFWYENGQFTQSELDEIRGTTLANLIERNTGITGLPTSVFTVDAAPVGPGAGGTAAPADPGEYRSIDGVGNNPDDPVKGSTGRNLRIDTSLNYADGISAPTGADRPSARVVSNGALAQSGSILNTAGATALMVFWGQILSHDTDLTPVGTSDTLKIHGDAITGAVNYPFVAEKINFLLGHPFDQNVDNAIARPIYLPKLDVAHGTTIDPSVDATVTTPMIPGAALDVAAGTLVTREGLPFTGVLSMTVVPSSLTPAALPATLFPDLVVSVQPAEMIFSTPAPLSLPNRSGYAAGTIMDLWSINPLTGEFDKVGTGKVSADGKVIDTISGGLRNSSWQFFAPPPPQPQDPATNDRNEHDDCAVCKAMAALNSDVELHSGQVVETHDLVSYQSLGVDRGLTLTYHSLRADPRHIVHLGYDSTNLIDDFTTDNYWRMVAQLGVSRGSFQYQVPGFQPRAAQPTDFTDTYFATTNDLSQTSWSFSATAGQRLFFDVAFDDAFAVVQLDGPTGSSLVSNSLSILGDTTFPQTVVLPATGSYTLRIAGTLDGYRSDFTLRDVSDAGLHGGENFFRIGSAAGAALEVDLRDQPSGVYDYTLTTGLRRFNGMQFSGSAATAPGTIVHVNEIGGPFGNGWSLAGWQSLVINPDGSVLLIDGDGSDMVFKAPLAAGQPYTSPPSDFSVLERLSDGTFRRTMTDQTVYSFNAANQLASVRDRNGNTTQYVYAADGRLTDIVDPVGLATTFAYTGGRVTAITDPAGRTTQLEYDAAGDLMRITDPDGSQRTWTYDADYHMTGETDQLGRQEHTDYNFAGRASHSVRRDGSEIFVTPLQVQGLFRPEETTDPFHAPIARSLGSPEMIYADGNGNVVRTLLAQTGQTRGTTDAVGSGSSVEYNGEFLPIKLTDARGHVTLLTYDSMGNLTAVQDELSGGGKVVGSITQPGEQDVYLFEGKSGQQLIYDALDNTFPASSVVLYDPDGYNVYLNTFYNSTDQDWGPITLAKDGTYRIVVSGSGASVGNYTFQLLDASAAQDLAIGTEVQQWLDPSLGTALFHFTGTAGQRVLFDSLSIASPAAGTWDVYERNASYFLQSGSLDSDMLVDLPVDGEYLLVISGGQAGAPLDVTFRTLDASSAPALTLAVPVSGQLNPSRQTQLYQLDGTAGQVVFFQDISASSAGVITWALYAADAPDYLESSGFEGGFLVTLPADGTYLLTVAGTTAGAAVDYQFQVVEPGTTTSDIAIGDDVSGQITQAGERHLFNFQGIAGQNLYFDSLDYSLFASSVHVLAPDGTDLFEFGYYGDATTDVGIIALPEDGTYQLVIQSQPQGSFANGTGTYRFRLLDVTAAAPTGAGSTIQGTLNPGTTAALYGLTGTAGERIGVVDVLGTGPSGGIVWSLYDLQQIDFYPFNSGYLAFGESLIDLPADGDYLLVIASYYGTASVDYQLQLTTPSTITEDISLGQDITGSIDQPGDRHLYQFVGTTGQRVFFDSLDNTSYGSGISLLAPDGSSLLPPWYGYSASDDWGPIALTQDGTYQLIVQGSDYEPGWTGSYQFRLFDESVASPIDPATTINGQLNPGLGEALYVFSATAGQRLLFHSLSVSSPLSARWQVFPPGANYTITSDDLDFDLVFDVSQTGDYLLMIAGFSDTAPLDYQFQYDQTTATTTAIAIGQDVSGTITQLGERQVYTFDGSVGQRILYDALGNSFPFSTVTLQAPDGTNVYLGAFQLSADADSGLIGLYQAGTYQLTVEGRGSSVGSFEFRLLDASAATAFTPGTDVSGRIDPSRSEVLYRFDATAGQRLAFTTSSVSRTSSARWTLHGPAGTFAMTSGQLESGLVASLPFTGTYLLVLAGADDGGPIDFTFQAAAPQTDTAHINIGAGAGGKRLTYDPVFSQVTSVTDDLGHQTLYAIDPANGNILTITRVVGDPGGTDDLVTQLTYTSSGLVDTITDPMGRVTDYDYDALGRLIAVTDAVGTADQGIRQYAYDTAGNIVAMTDENGNRTDYVYDLMNRLTQTIQSDPDGSGPLTSPTTSYAHDAAGNIRTVTDARGNATSFAVDGLDRVISSTDADGKTTSFTYDRAGNLVSTVDPLGHETRYRYDARHRLIETIDAEGGSTRFVYDADNNVVSITDPDGNTTTFAYDARNRLVSEIDPLGKTIKYEYDAADNQTARVDRDGRRIQSAYDDLNRLVTETWVGAGNVVNYAYDGAGNLLSAVDDQSALTFTYDSRDRVATVDNAGTPNAPHVVLTYSYDAVGNVLAVADTVDGAAGATTVYAYDALNRVSRITQAGTGLADKRVDFTYNPLGQFATIDRYADLAGTQLVAGSTYAYDALNRLTSLAHSGPAGTLAFYDLTYDAAGRITHYGDIDGSTDYTYDQTDQLTGADHSNGSNPDETYSYDANGNRTSSHLHGSGYDTDTANRLLSDGTYNYAYDDEGNLILRTEIATGATREFTWDYRNRLTDVVDRDGSGTETQRVAYTYDAFDRRISKAVDVTPGDLVDAAVTHFIYDREDVILDYLDVDGNNGAGVSVLAERYLHGPAVDQVFAQDDAKGNNQWLLADHLGSIRDVVDSSGVLADHILYDAYGNRVSETNHALGSRYQFAGREFDGETNLYFNRARYYSPSTGRFISEDPIAFVAGDPNYFRYAKNDPVRNIDPFGFQASSRPADPAQEGSLGYDNPFPPDTRPDHLIPLTDKIKDVLKTLNELRKICSPITPLGLIFKGIDIVLKGIDAAKAIDYRNNQGLSGEPIVNDPFINLESTDEPAAQPPEDPPSDGVVYPGVFF